MKSVGCQKSEKEDVGGWPVSAWESKRRAEVRGRRQLREISVMANGN